VTLYPSLRLPSSLEDVDGGSQWILEGVERRRIICLRARSPDVLSVERGRLASLALRAACAKSKRPGLGTTPRGGAQSVPKRLKREVCKERPIVTPA
jgi:hypothetical protein